MSYRREKASASRLSGAARLLDKLLTAIWLYGSWVSVDTADAHKKTQSAHMFDPLLDTSRSDTGHGTHTLDTQCLRLSVEYFKVRSLYY